MHITRRRLAVTVACHGAGADRPDRLHPLRRDALPPVGPGRARRQRRARSSSAARPTHVVGFAWDGSAWHQVPVQVDERDLVNPGQIYHRPDDIWPTRSDGDAVQDARLHAAGHASAPATPRRPRTRRATATPRSTRNDELSFLANDTGKQAAGSVAAPAGRRRDHPRGGQGDRSRSKTDRLRVPLPLPQRHAHRRQRGHDRREVHVQPRLGQLPDAPTRWATASLSPNNSWGFNPEHSTVVTPVVPRDVRRPVAEQRPGRHRQRRHRARRSSSARTSTRPVGCGRTEDTFDGGANNPGEGAFIVNISGPVRAIRSYLGANSYLYTANTHFFYPSREDLVTDVRGPRGPARLRQRRRLRHRHDGPEVLRPGEHGRADRRRRRTRSTPIAYIDRIDGAADVADGLGRARARS